MLNLPWLPKSTYLTYKGEETSVLNANSRVVLCPDLISLMVTAKSYRSVVAQLSLSLNSNLAVMKIARSLRERDR